MRRLHKLNKEKKTAGFVASLKNQKMPTLASPWVWLGHTPMVTCLPCSIRPSWPGSTSWPLWVSSWPRRLQCGTSDVALKQLKGQDSSFISLPAVQQNACEIFFLQHEQQTPVFPTIMSGLWQITKSCTVGQVLKPYIIPLSSVETENCQLTPDWASPVCRKANPCQDLVDDHESRSLTWPSGKWPWTKPGHTVLLQSHTHNNLC